MRMAVVKAVIRPTMKSCRLAISLIPPGPLEMHAKKRRAYECLIALRIAKCVKAEGLVFFSEKVAIQHRRVIATVSGRMSAKNKTDTQSALTCMRPVTRYLGGLEFIKKKGRRRLLQLPSSRRVSPHWTIFATSF